LSAIINVQRIRAAHFAYGTAGRVFFADAKTVIADAGYGSEENYLYAVGEDKAPRFDFLIPYGS